MIAVLLAAQSEARIWLAVTCVTCVFETTASRVTGHNSQKYRSEVTRMQTCSLGAALVADVVCNLLRCLMDLALA